MARKKKTAYTDPKLRERIKKKVQSSSKGGKPGTWSARKAQLMAQEYKAKGGGYRGGKGSRQKSLDKWTDEKWTTQDGRKAQRRGGTTRYLPKAAWDQLSDAEKKRTSAKKQAGSRAGKQYVSNTGAAKKARKKATTQRGKATAARGKKKTASAAKKKTTRSNAARSKKTASTAKKKTTRSSTARKKKTTRSATQKRRAHRPTAAWPARSP